APPASEARTAAAPHDALRRPAAGPDTPGGTVDATACRAAADTDRSDAAACRVAGCAPVATAADAARPESGAGSIRDTPGAAAALQVRRAPVRRQSVSPVDPQGRSMAPTASQSVQRVRPVPPALR